MARFTIPRPSSPSVAAAVSRREFIVLGSTLVGGAWAGDLLAAVPANLGWAAVDRDWPLSVGFVEGSDQLADLRALPWERRRGGGGDPFEEPVRVVPAAAMPLGDQNLALGTVEVGVRGLYPGYPPRRLEGFASTYLTVLVPSPDPLFPEPLPFFSWGAQRLPGHSTGSPTRFLVPLREDGGLEVVLEVRMPRSTGLEEKGRAAPRGAAGRRLSVRPAAPPPSVQRFYTDFTVDWYDGRPKLQRGLYLLGLAPGTWDVPADLPLPGGKPRYDLCSLVVSVDGVAEDDPRLTAG